MKLYHYTNIDHLFQILKDGEIKVTRSNIVRPINPQVVNGKFIDQTDNIKPVVWFSSLEDFEAAKFSGMGAHKTEVAIQVDTMGLQQFHKWDKWAIANGIDDKWFAILKRTAPAWEHFYITEAPVKITDSVRIIPRPDLEKWFIKTFIK